MSSTNRSDARSRHVSEYYVTPISEVVKFLIEFNQSVEDPLSKESIILDSCAGGSDNHAMSYPEALMECGYSNITTIDIRDDSLAEIKGNYLEIDCKDKYDAIITNPPFNIARDIIEKALSDVKDGGYVIMLLRLNYLESKARKTFFDNYMPKYIFVHHQRMSFTDDGKTDSVAYAHFCFQKGFNPEFSQLKVI